MPRTALIVEVPEADPLVYEWRYRYDNASLGIPAHITLLFPFAPAAEVDEALISELRELFAGQETFRFSLPRVARFPDHAWLAPDPPEPFTRLTKLIFERYPHYPPYEGVHETVIPHLTVAGGDAALQDEVEAALSPHLPIEATSREVTLIVEDESGFWNAAEQFALGDRPP